MTEDELIKLKDDIVFVTSNKGKVASAQKELKDINIEIFDYDFVEPRSDNVQEIAEYKVREAYNIIQKPCIALDAGFFIQALNGFPRAFVHFALDTLGIEGILKQMQGIDNRKCAFKECLAYYDGENMLYFNGNYEGTLSTEIRGKDTDKKWSDLWYIFIPYGYDKTLAEMTDEERNNRLKCSQNTSAMEELSDYYQMTKKPVK